MKKLFIALLIILILISGCSNGTAYESLSSASSLPAEASGAPGPVIAVSRADVKYIIELLWPLSVPPGTLGDVQSIDVSNGSLKIDINTDKSPKEAKEVVSEFVPGEWSDKDGAFLLGVSEGRGVGCTISQSGTSTDISFFIEFEGEYPELDVLLDSCWPDDAVRMPPEISRDPEGRELCILSHAINIKSYWHTPECEQVFQWFKDDLKDTPGIKHLTVDNNIYGRELLSYKLGDMDVIIGAKDEILTIDFSMDPGDVDLLG